MRGFLLRFSRDEMATTAIEYAIIAGGIALAIVAAVAAVGTGVSVKFTAIEAGVK